MGKDLFPDMSDSGINGLVREVIWILGKHDNR